MQATDNDSTDSIPTVGAKQCVTISRTIKATIFQTFPLSGVNNRLVSSLIVRFVANPQIKIREKKDTAGKKERLL